MLEFHPAEYDDPIMVDGAIVRSRCAEGIGLRFSSLLRSEERRLAVSSPCAFLIPPSNRTLKKSASFVLASLRGSTYRSVRLASSLAAALLDSLFEHPETIYIDAQRRF